MIRDLDLTPEQAAGLRELMDESNRAAEHAARVKDRLSVGFAMIVRGFGITDASNPVLNGTKLTVTLPDPPESA